MLHPKKQITFKGLKPSKSFNQIIDSQQSGENIWQSKLEGDYDDCEILISEESMKKNSISAINNQEQLDCSNPYSTTVDEYSLILNDFQKYINYNKKQNLKIKDLDTSDHNSKTLSSNLSYSKDKSPMGARTLQQFLNVQQGYQQQSEDKKFQLTIKGKQIQMDQQNMSTKPKINASKTLTEEKHIPVHQRLYQKTQKPLEEAKLPQFRPTILKRSKSMTRVEKIDAYLYNDALKRQKSKDSLEQKKQEIIKKNCNKKNLSTKSEQIVNQKFLKEFNIVSSKFPCIGFQDLFEILLALGFVTCRQDRKIKEAEQKYLHLIWVILQNNNHIQQQNLCKFLFCVLGQGICNDIGSEQSSGKNFFMDISEYENIQQMQVGTFNKGEWVISKKEYNLIHRQFQILQVNRLNFQEQKLYNPVDNTLKISNYNIQLADKHRKKQLMEISLLIQNNELITKVPSDNKITHQDMLILNKQKDQLKIQKKQIQNQENEMLKCTFQPNLERKSSINSLSKARYFSFKELGAKVTKPMIKSRKEELEEKELQECTFKPNIKKHKIVQQYTNIVETMKKEESSEKDNAILSPRPISETPSFLLPSLRPDIPPLVMIDVNLSQGHSEKLLIYPGDNVQEVVNNFARKHGLDQEVKKKFQILLENQIKSLLIKIDEEQISFSEESSHSKFFKQDY